MTTSSPPCYFSSARPNPSLSPMAVASSSASRSSGVRQLEEERRHSPIPYHVGPLQYDPPVFCHCGQKAVLWISWSDDNPGRRYMKCHRAREGDCDLYEWYEGPVDPFVSTLLVDLYNAVWALKRQKATLREALAEATWKVHNKEREMEELKLELDAAEAEKEEMRVMVKKLQFHRKIRNFLCVILVVCVVFRLLN
ncbi:hypothetical protein QOZ80_1BG0074670 [Eleusine coracana subsp. coracana]|nr:hypothetical protein QOZ80_1BG0074670 [Eleusine coracana subsp. coracana]